MSDTPLTDALREWEGSCNPEHCCTRYDAALKHARRLERALKVAEEAIWICSEHNSLYHGDNHNTTIESLAALRTIAKLKEAA